MTERNVIVLPYLNSSSVELNKYHHHRYHYIFNFVAVALEV